jgi:hypothetical protein
MLLGEVIVQVKNDAALRTDIGLLPLASESEAELDDAT